MNNIQTGPATMLHWPCRSWDGTNEVFGRYRSGEAVFACRCNQTKSSSEEILHLSAARSNSHRRLEIRDAKSFVTSKSPDANRMVPGRSCGAWTAPSKNTHHHLSEKMFNSTSPSEFHLDQRVS